MDAFLRRGGRGTASEVEIDLWVREQRRRWLVHMAGPPAPRHAGAIARSRPRPLAGLPITRISPRG